MLGLGGSQARTPSRRMPGMRFSHCSMRLNKHNPHRTAPYHTTPSHPHQDQDQQSPPTYTCILWSTENVKMSEEAGRQDDGGREREADTYSLACLDRLTKQTLRHVFCLYTLRIRTVRPHISYLRFVSARQDQHPGPGWVPSPRHRDEHIAVTYAHYSVLWHCGRVLNPRAARIIRPISLLPWI